MAKSDFNGRISEFLEIGFEPIINSQ